MRQLLLLTFLLCSIAAQAAPTLLVEQGTRIRAIVKTLPGTPQDWRFIVLDEVQWKQIMSKSGTRLMSQTTISNLETHFTFIREGYAIAATDYKLRRSLAHEMGHRMCACQDEDKANFYQDQILKQDSH